MPNLPPLTADAARAVALAVTEAEASSEGVSTPARLFAAALGIDGIASGLAQFVDCSAGEVVELVQATLAATAPDPDLTIDALVVSAQSEAARFHSPATGTDHLALAVLRRLPRGEATIEATGTLAAYEETILRTAGRDFPPISDWRTG